MTADGAMRVRARSEGLEVLFVPEELLRLPGNPEPSADVLELEAVEREERRLGQRDGASRVCVRARPHRHERCR
jgi:hypothetical protein